MSKHVLRGLIVVLVCAMPVFAQDAEAGYQEALRRIEEARVSEAIELDLSWLFLTAVTLETSQLTHLQTLYLNGNQLSLINRGGRSI